MTLADEDDVSYTSSLVRQGLSVATSLTALIGFRGWLITVFVFNREGIIRLKQGEAELMWPMKGEGGDMSYLYAFDGQSGATQRGLGVRLENATAETRRGAPASITIAQD